MNIDTALIPKHMMEANTLALMNSKANQYQPMVDANNIKAWIDLNTFIAFSLRELITTNITNTMNVTLRGGMGPALTPPTPIKHLRLFFTQKFKNKT